MIPGLSGGTVAVAVGAFEHLLEAIVNLRRSFIRSITYLITIAIGVLMGVLSISPVIEYILRAYGNVSDLFFCFVSVIGAIIFITRSIGFKNINLRFLLLGMMICVLFSILINSTTIKLETGYGILLIPIGILLSIALILPGISFSYMLLFFNIYDIFVSSINSLNIKFLLPLAFGIIVGTYIFSKILNNLIKTHQNKVYSLIFGFLCISIFEIIFEIWK